MHIALRSLGASVAATVLTVALTSCGDDGGGSGDAASGEGFPVTIESALGTAEIPDTPERVVTLGQGSAETSIALGNVPVGIEEYEWGSDETGYLPWIHEAVTEEGEELPEQFRGGEDIDFEAIIELEPDVVLAPWSGITQEDYDILEDIAPTVAYPDLPWSTDWDQQIELIGQALGQPDEAAGLIEDIENTLAETAEDNPQFEDVTFSYIYTDGPGTLGVFLPDEQRVAMVRGMGLTVDPVVEEFPETEGTDSALIGLENADQLSDSDLVFTFYSNEEDREEIQGQELYGAIPAVENDAVVSSEDNAFVTASSLINPLTVPWVTERYVPMIDEALENAEG